MDEPGWQVDATTNLSYFVLKDQVDDAAFWGAEPAIADRGPMPDCVNLTRATGRLNHTRALTTRAEQAILFQSIITDLPLNATLRWRQQAVPFKDNAVIPYEGIRARR
jgi:hypothetical protein